jgi:hypothetical protein
MGPQSILVLLLSVIITHFVLSGVTESPTDAVGLMSVQSWGYICSSMALHLRCFSAQAELLDLTKKKVETWIVDCGQKMCHLNLQGGQIYKKGGELNFGEKNSSCLCLSPSVFIQISSK